MESATVSKWKRWLRWIAVLPCAIAGGVLAYYAIRLLTVFFVTWHVVGLSPESWLLRVCVELTSNFALGVAFVYLGSQVSPSAGRAIVWVLAGFVVLCAGFLLFPTLLTGDWWGAYSIAALASGSGLYAYGTSADNASGQMARDQTRGASPPSEQNLKGYTPPDPYSRRSRRRFSREEREERVKARRESTNIKMER